MMNGQIKCGYIHTMAYYPVIKRDNVRVHANTWMDEPQKHAK